MIASEWAAAIIRQAVAAGMKCVYISNSTATRQAREGLECLRPTVSGHKIDLKTMSDRNYRRLGISGVWMDQPGAARRTH